jgi:hypothetical protein
MNTKARLSVVPLAFASAAAFGAAPNYQFIDKSSPALIDEAGARAAFREIADERLAKVYSPSRWGFVTQVSGGMTPSNTCVVTARVMLLPRNNPRPTQLLNFKPERMATTYDALPNATVEACRALARQKLDEALQAITAGVTH